MVELLDDWNVDVPSWNYPRNFESPKVSSPGFGNDSKMMTNAFNQRISPVWSGQHTHRDVNPIEHVWGMLGRRIASRQRPPTCLPELRETLLDEWCNFPQDQFDNLILSMPRCCKTCIASSGRHTPY
ncbi:DDE_3 domain-containing protein [Trichonephila clavipes]|nr:DDE_3 domain-containing protein [Trichonephila clavipes]